MFGFGKATAKLASLFGELAEIQKQIDDSARKIVEGIVRMIDAESDESPSSREALAGRDLSWYQEVSGALTNNGFDTPAAYEPTDWMSRPVESRALVEYALGDGGTIVACWFAIPATETRAETRVVSLSTFFDDGSTYDTVAGGSPALLWGLETEREERLAADTPVTELLARHRAYVARYASTPRRVASVDAYLAARKERKRVRRAYWTGMKLSLVERYIGERFTGDRAEVGEAYLDAIRKHPEWYKYANGDPDAPTDAAANGVNGMQPENGSTPHAASDEGTTVPRTKQVRDVLPTMPIRFMMSETPDGRRTLTTFGMLFAGVPELLMREVAANHCRAARVLAGTVVAGLARHRSVIPDEAAFLAELVSERGARFTVMQPDAITAGVNGIGDAPDDASVDVHLALRGFTPDDEPSLLLVNPLPDDARSLDERLREACARLGVEVPAARGVESGDDAMREAHERAVARLDDARARWMARAASGEKVLVKYRATDGERGEYVWIQVHDWRDGTLGGEVVTPAPRIGLSRNQSVAIEQAQIYDYLVLGPSGTAVPALTDLVATDYGMDV